MYHLSDCVPSAHFLEKKEKRGVSWDTIREIVEKPSVIETAGVGRRRLSKDGVAIVISAGSPTVLITILLRQQDQWTDEDVKKYVGKNKE